ncbi:glycosyltransferase family 4 protein [Oscillatoria sp. CS-180]|uniref:glycosyltransferase family 4 protein n=1 Tax=Oscillatoria sp. CS-180 TaxID=3021720 RepID=UPI002330041D|nr:glycosyltransferase family 4 protein [Oscillatoria sp. CS-180]MDB9525411.1 glycosyltransferase family 4 protein [Oscillatoria sp. CS-180]
MNLLYCLTAYPPFIGGSQIHQHQLAKVLAEEHLTQVICHWNQHRTDWLLGTTLFHPKGGNYSYEGISVHQLELGWKEKLCVVPVLPLYYPFMEYSVKLIANILAPKLKNFAQRADVIHAVRIGREGLIYTARQLAAQLDIPFVLTPVHHPRWQGWRYRVYNELYRRADALIALTDHERQMLIETGVKPERIHVTGVGPILAHEGDGERFCKTYNINSPFVLFLGQHYLYKGFRQLLEATSLVWKSCPDMEFVFAGPAVKQSEQFFKTYRDRRIHRLGTLDLQTKTDVLAACSILCVPSSQESFGGVFTEAWSFKKPVIGGRIPAVADVISHGEDGLLVEQRPEEIAEAICTLWQQPDYARRMGEAGYHKVKAQFTWPQLANKTLQIYQQLL